MAYLEQDLDALQRLGLTDDGHLVLRVDESLLDEEVEEDGKLHLRDGRAMVRSR